MVISNLWRVFSGLGDKKRHIFQRRRDRSFRWVPRFNDCMSRKAFRRRSRDHGLKDFYFSLLRNFFIGCGSFKEYWCVFTDRYTNWGRQICEHGVQKHGPIIDWNVGVESGECKAHKKLTGKSCNRVYGWIDRIGRRVDRQVGMYVYIHK